jgi:hypothetical protein
MEVDQLTDEQIANLTPEQIEMLENDASVGGYITQRRLTPIESVTFGETISDLTDEAL